MSNDELMVAAVVGGISFGFLTTPLLAFAKDAFTSVLRWLVGLVVVTHKLDSVGSDMLLTYMKTNAQSLVSSRESYGVNSPYNKKLKRRIGIFFRRLDETNRLSRYRGALIWFAPAVIDKNEDMVEKCTVSYLRWTLNWEQLLVAACLAYDKTKHKSETTVRVKNRPYIQRMFGSGNKEGGEDSGISAPPHDFDDDLEYTYSNREPVGWSLSELGKESEPLPGISGLGLCPATEAVFLDIKRWHASKDWYAERGVPWRRGYMLHGKPGTGKTSLVRGISEELGLNIISIDLASCDNQDLYKFWKTAKQNTPCILLLEDIDSVFHGRQNVVPGGELTFDALLNCIDGIDKSDGIVLFVTTNHLEHIDPALGIAGPEGSSRPGRIDMVAELPYLDTPGKVKIATRILQDAELAKKVSEEHKSVTGAQFQEICCQLALKLFWAGKE